ncbi:MAG: flippase-like domain-containing protein [Anaerolineae bacterium]|nr:flippase-like domain-containing protein [Anaerolineae bacterium]
MSEETPLPASPANTADGKNRQAKANHSRWLRWLGTLLSICLLIYLLSQQGWKAIAAAATQIAWWRFVLALAFVMISRFAVAGRWHTLMHSAGTGITPRQSLRLTFAMLFASNFLPTTIGGDVIRYAGAVRLGFDNAISLASLVVDRLVGMTGMAMALPFGISAYIQYFSGATTSSSLALPWLNKLSDKFSIFLRDLWQAIKIWLKKPGSLLTSLGFTWVHMLCTFATVSVLLAGMGEQISFWLIMGLWSATYFITLLPVSINGLGVQELAMTFFYVGMGGISPASGLTLAIIMRLLQMIASLPGALFIPDIVAGKK